MKKIFILLTLICLAPHAHARSIRHVTGASSVTEAPRPPSTKVAPPVCEASSWTARSNDAFTEHERLEYAVKWGGLKAGRGIISVNGIEPFGTHRVYRLSMDLGTTGVGRSLHQYDERSETWLDQPSLLPVKSIKQTREGAYARDEQFTFDQGCRTFERYEHRLDKGTEQRKTGTLAGDALDILGYLYHLRTLPLAEGGHYDLTLVSGEHVWPVTVNVLRRLKIATPSGWYDCFFLEPTLRAGAPADTTLKELQVWVTADARHIPVRLRMEANVGHVTAELMSTQNTK